MHEAVTESKELRIKDAISPEAHQPPAEEIFRRISSCGAMLASQSEPSAEGGYF